MDFIIILDNQSILQLINYIEVPEKDGTHMKYTKHPM